MIMREIIKALFMYSFSERVMFINLVQLSKKKKKNE